MTPTGEILDDCLISQALRVDRDFFSGLAIMVSTYSRRNTSRLVFRLHRESELVVERTVEVSSLVDNREFELYFPPRSLSEGPDYRLTIEALGAIEGNAATVWLEANDFNAHEFPQCIISGVERRAKRLRIRALYSPVISDQDGPLTILFSPVTQCNLNCTHCISRDTRKTLQAMPEATKAEIADLARTGTLEYLTSDYSGDIFFIDEKYGGALDYIFGLNVDLYLDSHGNHMSRELGLRLLHSKLRRINFSLDAATNETHKGIRRGSRPLTEIIENIRLLMELRRELGKTDVEVTVSMTLMRRNLHEVPALIDLACELGIHTVITRHIEVYTDDMEEESLFVHQKYFNGMVDGIRKHAQAKGMPLILPEPFPDTTAQIGGHRFCPVPWESIAVLGNGDVMACCVPSSKIGSVKTSTIREIWNGPIYQEFRRRVNSQDPPAVCQACPVFRLENNPDSYLFNRVRKNLPTLFDDLTQSLRARNARAAGRTTPVAVAAPVSPGGGQLDLAAWFAGPFRRDWQKARRADPAGQGLASLSVGAWLEGNQRLTMGLTLQKGPVDVLVRAAGPALEAAGLRAAMPAPKLEFFDHGAPVHENQGWSSALTPLFTRIGASPFPAGSRDAAIVGKVSGQRTITAHGKRAGHVLVEVFDGQSSDSGRIVNLSARAKIGPGKDLFAAFTLRGAGQKQVLLRVVGPALANLGVKEPAAAPKMTLYSPSGDKLAENTGWDGTLASVFSQVGAHAFPPGSRDAALFVTVAAGESHTLQVGSADGSAGEVNIEIYALP